MKTKILIVILSAAIIIGSVVVIPILMDEETTEEKKSSDEPIYPSLGNITSFDDAVNHLAFNMFRKIVNDPQNSGNCFYSPYSIFTALAMCYEGAEGNTAVEMKNVLGIEQDNESFQNYMKALYEYLNINEEYNISTANALWPDVGFNLLQEFTDTIETYYGGKATEVEYGDPTEAAEIINTWVEEQTNNLIKDLVPPSAIDPIWTKLILTNAIYFKGVWQIQFDEENTTEREFILPDGSTKQVETMKLVDTEDEFNYTETDDLQILELPYSGGDISMIIILPKDGVEIDDIINSITKEEYKERIDEMTSKEADIYLPKYKVETSYGIGDYLIDLGMIDAFAADADFSGITGTRDLFIDKVLHKAFVEVNEEGTEAAAATAVIMALNAADPNQEPSRIIFDCNHPFIFTIHHKETGTILFMGEVMNPAE